MSPILPGSVAKQELPKELIKESEVLKKSVMSKQ
jgi:hypothetical protein